MFNYTTLNAARPKAIYLARPGGRKAGKLNGIESARVHMNLRDMWTLDFEVDKYINGSMNPLYGQLKPLTELIVEDLGYFRINILPEEIQEDGRIYRHFTAYGIETQLSDCEIPMLYINNGTEDSMEMFEENVSALGSPKRKIVFYIPHENNDPSSKNYWGLGLINILMHNYFAQKGWSVGEISLPLCSKNRTFDIDAIDGYAFLMSDASNAFECIFIFDRIHKTISAYPTADYGKSLNIECSFRNLLNNVHIRDRRDTIYTRFRVQGANEDTSITYVNFGRDTITNLSYILSPADYPQSFIEKYRAYEAYCESRRNEYAGLWTDYLTLQEQKNALINRMPIDAVTSQWNAYELDDLKRELSTFEQMLKELEAKYPTSSSQKLQDSPDYGLYLSIKNVIIPDIHAEINRRETDPDKNAPRVDYTFDWELYGINGLKERRNTCEYTANALKDLGYGVPWSNNSNTNKANHDLQYANYVKMATAVKDIDVRLVKLNRQVDAWTDRLAQLASKRSQIVEAVDIRHPDFAFTESELAAIDLLLIDTDYVDKSIEVLDETDVAEKVALAWELLKSAQNQLEIECRPQTSFELDLDNIYRIPAFMKAASHLACGDFLHMELDGGYKTRQRIIEMEFELVNFNDNDLIFTFSDMTNAYGTMDDLRFLADNANASSKSSITRNNKKYVSDVATSAANNVLNQYFSGSASVFPNGFSSEDIIRLSDALSGLVDGNLTLDELKVKLAQIDSLNADSAFVKYLETQFLVGDQAQFQSLLATVAQIKAAILGDFSAAQGMVVNLTASTATVDELFVRRQVAQYIFVNDLKAQDISTDRFTVTSGNGGLKIAGNTMQFTNASGDIRMQVGQDASGRFSFIICDENGSVLLDSTGLHPAAITDGLIKNNMIGDGEISKNKVNWADAGFIVDDSGKIWTTGAHIKVDNQSLDAAFTAMTDTVSENTSQLKTQASSIQANANQIQNLITATTITKSDGTTISVKEQLNQTITDVKGTKSRIGTLETKYDQVSGDITSLESTQADYTKTLEQFGVEMTSVKKTTETLSTDVKTLSDATEKQLNKFRETLNETSIKVDSTANSIVNKVWQQDISTAVNNYDTQVAAQTREKLALQEQNLNGFKQTVSDTYTTKTAFDQLTIGGRNLALNTSGDYSEAFTQFTGAAATEVVLAKVLNRGLSVGDTVTLRLHYKYSTITAVSGSTARVRIQGSGDITAGNAGKFPESTYLSISGNGEHIFLYSFIINENHLKNDSWSITLYHDHVQGGSVQWKEFKVERGTKPSGWTPAPEDLSTKTDMNGYVDKQVKSINESISNANQSISTITSQYESVNSELTSLKKTVDSSFIQNATDISMKFNQALESINDLSSSTDSRFNNLSTYIRFDSNGIELGESNNPIKLNITNSAILFSNGGLQLAKMEGQQLTIDQAQLINAEVQTSLKIGRFVFEPRSNGNLSLLKK